MQLINAFKYAFQGIYIFFSKDFNGRLELGIAIITIAAGFVLHISKYEWITVLLCIAIVLSLEMINTTIEKLCDMIEPGVHPTIKMIKDIAAGAVLLSAIVSLVIGLIIFLPKIIIQIN